MGVQQVNQFLDQYGNVISSSGQTAEDISSLYGDSHNYNYNYGAPQPSGGYQYAQDLHQAPSNPLDYMYQPTAGEEIMQGLQYGKMGTDLLGTKLGSKTLGQGLFPNAEGAGAGFSNPLTTNASAGTFDLATAAEGQALTSGQMASNYFQNVGQGSVSAGLPMYMAGRLVRSAFDDDDPTTFTGGEMLGAGISGAGAGSAIAGYLNIVPGWGWAIGLGLSLLGGKKKRDKARAAQKEYDEKVAQYETDVKELYAEGISDYRESIQKRSQANEYYNTAAEYDNPYGGSGSYGSSGYYAEGGLTPKEKAKVAKMGRNGDTELAHINPVEADMLKYLGGSGTVNPKTGLKEYHFSFSHVTSAIQNVLDPIMGTVGDVLGTAGDVVGTGLDIAGDVATTGLDIASDVATDVGGAAADVMDATGATNVLDLGGDIISTGMENIVEPVIEGAAGALEHGVEAGLDIVGDAVDFGFGMAEDVMGAIGNEIVFPVMDFAGDYVSSLANDVMGLFDGPDIVVPDMPALPDSLFTLNEPEAPIQDPNIVTIDPYTGRPVTEVDQGANFASGSLGFIGPDIEEEDGYSSRQSTE